MPRSRTQPVTRKQNVFLWRFTRLSDTSRSVPNCSPPCICNTKMKLCLSDCLKDETRAALSSNSLTGDSYQTVLLMLKRFPLVLPVNIRVKSSQFPGVGPAADSGSNPEIDNPEHTYSNCISANSCPGVGVLTEGWQVSRQCYKFFYMHNFSVFWEEGLSVDVDGSPQAPPTSIYKQNCTDNIYINRIWKLYFIGHFIRRFLGFSVSQINPYLGWTQGRIHGEG